MPRKAAEIKLFLQDPAALPPGLPPFMYTQRDATPATYSDQLKIKGPCKKRGPPAATREEETDQLEPAQVQETEAETAAARSGQAAPTKARKVGATGKKVKAAAGASAAVAEPKPKKSKANEDDEVPRKSAEEPGSETCDIGDDAVKALFDMSAEDIQAKYDAKTTPDWVQRCNVYSNGYRKAVEKAKLTKAQARLRGQAAACVWAKGGKKLYIPKLSLGFTKPRARKNKQGEDKSMEKNPEVKGGDDKSLEENPEVKAGDDKSMEEDPEVKGGDANA